VNEKRPFGRLYIVATPIGDPDDISQRAIETLKSVDLVLCEERKNGSRLLKQLGVQTPLAELNEHNERTIIQDYLLMLMEGKNLALVSDCGTPVFSDPGRELIRVLQEMGIPISPIPGASSLMAAISVCPFNLDRFHFAGFLPPKAEERERALQKLSNTATPLILMDTPYRMVRLLEDVTRVFGKKQRVFLACDLTLRSERLLLGEAEQILHQVQNQKAEFILVLDTPSRRK